jgi:RHS repeat-associated protein
MLSEGDTARHLEYDCVDRLRCFYVKTGIAEPSKYTHYLYDGDGNRVKKITRTQGDAYTATTYIDEAFEYTKESSVGEQNILHIMGGATRRIGDALGDSTPAIKYNLSDHLGSSMVLLDTNGTTLSLEEYYPFGQTSFGSYAKKRYRFCGKEKDEESGLYYYGMRYYSPWTCRFINVDPLAGKYPFYTPYQYAGNKPINFIDLDGGEEKPNPTTNSGNDNLQSHPTPGGGTVNVPSDASVKTAKQDFTGELTGGAKIAIPKSSVTSFETNGVKYTASFTQDNDTGSWQFSRYTDEHGEPYANPEMPASTPENPSFKGDLNIMYDKNLAAENLPQTTSSNQNYTPPPSPVITQTKVMSQWQKSQNSTAMYWDQIRSNPNSIYHPSNYNRFEMRLARAAGDGLVTGAEAATGELALARISSLYSKWRYGDQTLKVFQGTEPAWDIGATPNSIYTYTSEGRAISNHIYDSEGKIMFEVNFKHHGVNPSGHGHYMSIPGVRESGHMGKHIDPLAVSPRYLEIPYGLRYKKPF